MRTWRIAVVIVGVLGCKGGSGGSIPPDELGEALIDALCGRFVRCGVIEDQAACLDLFGGQIDTSIVELENAIANGTVLYDGVATARCLDAFEQQSCDETSESVRVEPQACDDAIRGTVADGGGCFIATQCISRECNIPSCPGACCEGTCDPTVAEAQLGESCVTALCAEGAFCNGTDVCEALLAAGQPCTGDNECGYGLNCPNTNLCADAPNLGDPCPDGGCADLGTSCSSSMVCVAGARRGEACPVGTGCVGPSICNTTTRICEAPPAIGQPCQFQCESGAFCDQTTNLCTADKADGAACNGDNECASRFCDPTSICATEAPCI